MTITLPFSASASPIASRLSCLGAVEEAAGVDEHDVGAGIVARERIALRAQRRQDAFGIDEGLWAAEADQADFRGLGHWRADIAANRPKSNKSAAAGQGCARSRQSYRDFRWQAPANAAIVPAVEPSCPAAAGRPDKGVSDDRHPQKYAPWMLGVLRIVTALVFMEHGTQKLFHFPASGAPPGGGGAAQAALGAAEGAVRSGSLRHEQHVDHGVAPCWRAPRRRLRPARPAAALHRRCSSSPASSRPLAGWLSSSGLLTRPIAFLVAGETRGDLLVDARRPSGNDLPRQQRRRAQPCSSASRSSIWSFAGPGAFALDGLLRKRAV